MEGKGFRSCSSSSSNSNIISSSSMEALPGESLYSTMFSSPIMGKIMAILDDDDDYWDQVLIMLIDQGYFDPSSSEEEEEEPSDFGGISDSASGSTSSMKRLRVSPPIPTPTSNRRRKIDGRSEAMSELVELRRKRAEITEAIMQLKLQARPKVHSIEECMERLTTVAHLSPDGLFTAREALKDERNRPIFMTLSGEHLSMWIDRQISMQQLYATQRPAAPSFPPATPSFPPAIPFFPAPPTPYTPGSSSFPAAFLPPTVSTFSPGAPSFPSNAPSNPPKGPPFPPN